MPASLPTCPRTRAGAERLMVPGLHNLITQMPPVDAAAGAVRGALRAELAERLGHGVLPRHARDRAASCACGRRGSSNVYVATFKQLKFAMLTIASMLGLAYLMNYSGMTSTLGLALAATGAAFPFFSAVVGWLGVFLTGSDTSANALFGNLQVVTANALGLNPILTASVNSAAGVMGKMISVQSIAVAVAATGMTPADESRLFRFTIKHSVLLMVVVGLLSIDVRLRVSWRGADGVRPLASTSVIFYFMRAGPHPRALTRFARRPSASPRHFVSAAVRRLHTRSVFAYPPAIRAA